MKVISSDDAGNNLASEKNSQSTNLGVRDSDEIIDNFILRNEANDFGYQTISKNGDVIKLTNFIVVLEDQVNFETESKTVTYFTGYVQFENDDHVPIRKLFATEFSNSQSLVNYLTNLCGTKVAMNGPSKSIVEAIKAFNREVQFTKAVDLGYSEDQNSYTTSNMIITSDSITETETPILYSEVWQRNKLGFATATSDELRDLKSQIIDLYLPWDDTARTISSLSFTLLPLLFPFLNGVVDKKMYLMLKGPSGCGKSLMSEILQNFYGDYKNLSTWNSTSTAISVAGHSHKDTIFMVDDLKHQNFTNETEVKKLMTLIQNYADQTARARSNTSLTLRDEKYLRGFLFISAEDLVITEASTIARGIIINMENKKPDLEGEKKLRRLSKNFNKMTPYFIQYILNDVNKNNIPTIFLNNLKFFEEFVNREELDGNNIPRIINNFALLKTGWEVLREFLFSDSESIVKYEYDFIFNNDLYKLFIENYNRVQIHNPEIKFEETLWELIEGEMLILSEIGVNDNEENKRVGFYKKTKTDDGTKIKISINLRKAYKAVNLYLIDQGGIGNSLETLETKLVQLGKIRTVETGRISFGSNKTQRGVEWIGEYPKHFFGIEDSETSEIVDNSETIRSSIFSTLA